jgi:NitT/TauT family transport system permease protein
VSAGLLQGGSTGGAAGKTPGVSKPRPSGRLRGIIETIYPPLAFGIAGLALWEFGVRISGIKSFILPAPTNIALTLVEIFPRIAAATLTTLQAVALGLLIGVTSGVAAALLVSLAKRLSAPLMTTAVVLSCAPIIALSPIFNAWFGVTNLLSKAAVAAVMVFFPVFVNSTQGLLVMRPLHRELMESLSASSGQTMRLVRIPEALPSFFDGLRVAATVSVIGVLVAEYFGGSANALGVLIANEAALSHFEVTWAGVVMASALGLVLYGAVVLLERVCVPWKRRIG